MNALMLASQRGHHIVAMLLIKAGAVMDEQTAQGSTALMLACKRGHEEVVNVLVSMGAEIYMRDNRNRTAADTALRRSHTKLLKYLNTQTQTILYQKLLITERNQLLMEYKNARMNGHLVFNINTAIALRLYGIIGIGELTASLYKNKFISMNDNINNKIYIEEIEKLKEYLNVYDINNFTSTNNINDNTTTTSTTNHPTNMSMKQYNILKNIINIKNLENNNIIKYSNNNNHINQLMKPRDRYNAFQWSAILMRYVYICNIFYYY
jgi:hypothetical protein